MGDNGDHAVIVQPVLTTRLGQQDTATPAIRERIRMGGTVAPVANRAAAAPSDVDRAFRFSPDVLAAIRDLPSAQANILPVLVMSINPAAMLRDTPGAPTMSQIDRWRRTDDAFNNAYNMAWAEWNSWLMTNGGTWGGALARRFCGEAVATLVSIMRGDVFRNPESHERVLVAVPERRKAAESLYEYGMMGTAVQVAEQTALARNVLSGLNPEEQQALLKGVVAMMTVMAEETGE